VQASSNITALKSTGLFTNPTAVNRLPTDLKPSTAGATHQLGNSGWAWLSDRNVCVLMANRGPGGCFTTFTKPVVLYLWGDATGFNAGGVVPDSVATLSLMTSAGTIPVTINGNAFYVALPVNTSISGEQVTLTNGTTFLNEDPVAVPHV
jgi:hypothetical protein